jgi:plastocyanin
MTGKLLLSFLHLAITIVAASTATSAIAGDVIVSVTDSSGKPVRDAVVMLDMPGNVASSRPAQYRVTQKEMEFQPFVLVIRAGSTVDFANLDPVRHHVYSFSEARKFELKLFGKGESRAVRFDQPGVVAIGCNIHDSMQGFIYVVNTPLAARTGPDGKVSLRGAPAGVHSLRIWHPMMRAPGNQTTQKINTTSNINVPVAIKLRRAAPMGHDY